jgi:plasmid replication initiation protein
MLERKKNLELKKHVATIHSSNKLSLLQRKIANALLFNAYDDLLVKEEYEIHIGTLCKLIGYDSNDHKLIKKALVNLLATVIEWNLVDGNKVDSEGVWNASSIIADASIDGPLCTYSYSNKMKKLLHRPELYGRLNMLVQAKFQSSYGLALYENCIRYQDIQQTPWFELTNFRKLMGIEEGKYKIFRDFKHRVLDKAVEEVNLYSPIFVEPQLRKQNRQVVAIQFLIKQAKGGTPVLVENEKPSSLQDRLKYTFGLSNKQLEAVLSAHTEDYILEKMNVVESSPSFQTGKIKNLAQYLLSALKEDYQPPKSSRTPARGKNKQDALQQIDQIDQKRRKEDQRIVAILSDLSAEEKKEIFKKFERYLKGMYRTIYERDGMSNFQIQNQWCLFVREKMPELLEEIFAS